MCMQYNWLDIAILGALTELQKVNTKLRHVCPSVRSRGTARLPLGGVPRNLIFEYFSQISREIEV